jgi:phosphoribosyl 1,2-cyclic phosphodiesterase
MSMRFCILGSGSSGNAAFLQTEGARVLIDAGFSTRRLGALLAAVGESLERIDAIFLTHEHGDHTAALDGLKKHPHLRIFANAATARAVQTGLSHRPDWQIFETGTSFRFRDLEVHSFSVPHDAQEPVGFRFTAGREGDLSASRRSLVWVTDLGYAPLHVHEHLRAADIIVLESNYCPELLQADPRRPWSLKQRIGGRHGHLSNQGARELIEAVGNPRWRHVFLAHLSRDCNSIAAVESALAGIRLTLTTCVFAVVGPGEGTPFYDFT